MTSFSGYVQVAALTQVDPFLTYPVLQEILSHCEEDEQLRQEPLGMEMLEQGWQVPSEAVYCPEVQVGFLTHAPLLKV